MQKTTENRYIPVPKWNNYHDYPSAAGLRWLIFHEKTNGFNKVVRRIGRRVLISEKDYFEWVEAINNKNGVA